MNRKGAIQKRDIIVTQLINELGITIETNTKPLIHCEECKHRDPENKRCDCGALERQGCPFPVNDWYFCLYGERKE